MNVIQKKDETLREYFRRFSEEVIEVTDAALDVVIAALVGGCNHDNFVNNLVENPPITIPEVIKRAEVYINAEETLNGRKHFFELRKKEEDKPAKRRDEKKNGEKKSNKGESSTNAQKKEEPRFHNFTTLTLPRSEILMEIKKDGYISRAPPSMKTDPWKRSKKKFCDYHKDHDHTTDEYQTLKDDIEELIHRGSLKKYIKRSEDRCQERTPEPGSKDGSQLRLVGVIAGGRDVGGKRSYEGDFRLAEEEAKRTKKELPFTLSITEDDLRGLLPKSNRSIIIKAQIEKTYDVRCVLIDTGSSVDILYVAAFEQMSVGRE